MRKRAEPTGGCVLIEAVNRLPAPRGDATTGVPAGATLGGAKRAEIAPQARKSAEGRLKGIHNCACYLLIFLILLLVSSATQAVNAASGQCGPAAAIRVFTA